MSIRRDIAKYYLYRVLVKRFFLPVLVLFMVDGGLSVPQIALIAGLSYAVNIVLEVPSGAIADALGHKRTLVIAEFVMAIAVACYLFGSFAGFLVGNVLFFAAWSFTSGTDSAILFERLKEAGRESEYLKIYGRAKGLARGVGIVELLFASPLYLLAPWVPFVIGVAQFFVAALVIATFTEAKRSVSVKQREGFARVFEKFPEARRVFLRHPALSVGVLVASLLFGAFIGAQEFHQVLLNDVGFAVVLFGAFYSVKRIFGVFATVFAHRIVHAVSRARFFLLAGVVMSVPFLLLPITQNPYVIAGLLLVPYVLADTVSLSINEYINDVVEGSARATVLSVSTLITSLMTIGAIAIVGGSLGAYPLVTGYVFLGVTMLLALGLLLPWFFYLGRSRV